MNKYQSLRAALDAAYDQAATGKGRERHANNLPFDRQPLMAITRMAGLAFPVGQVMKKAQEAAGMAGRGEIQAARRELLGAINYAAAAWLHLGQPTEWAEASPHDPAAVEEVMARLKAEHPAVEHPAEDGPPVPWDEVPDYFRCMTREADGTIGAWTVDRSGRLDRCLCLRGPDCGEHEPRIWERP